MLDKRVTTVFDFLRFPLILGVVFIHSYGEKVDIMSIDPLLNGWDKAGLFLKIGISHVLCHTAVPLFFLISGYLFFSNLEVWDFHIYKTKLLRRLKTVLIPFLIWNTLAILLSILWMLIHGEIDSVGSFFKDNGAMKLYWNCRSWNSDRTNLFGQSLSSSAPFLVPLWYLRDLMVTFLLAPLFYLFFKYLKWVAMAIIIILYLLNFSYQVRGFALEPETVMWFGAGAFLKINNIDYLSVLSRFSGMVYSLFFVLLCFCTRFDGHMTEIGNTIYPFFVVFGCMAVMHFSSYCTAKGCRIHPLLTKSAFFMYLFHTLPPISPIIVSKTILEKVGAIPDQMISFLLTPLLVVVISVVSFILLNTALPGFCSVLTGSRN